MSFLTDDIMKGTDWRALERSVARLMSQCGWLDVAIIGRSGDMGADIVGTRKSAGAIRSWVVQVKAIMGGGYVGTKGLEEIIQAQSIYGAQIAALATNGDFYPAVYKRKKVLEKAGFEVRLWNGTFLKGLIEKWPEKHHLNRPLREYQKVIIDKAIHIFDEGGRRAQYVVATGLGKTVIAGEIAIRLWNKGCCKILVLCHSQDLALQLEQGFWPRLGKSVPTRYFFDGTPPLIYEGVNFGLYQTLIGYLSGIEPGTFDVVIVDEAHHALSHGFRKCVEHLAPRFIIGMTATPWRGDGKSIDDLFGEPIARVSLVDGMAMGFLSQVDYRLYCDNIDWDAIPTLSQERLSIRDLNKRLFLPQRDEAVMSKINLVIGEIKNPRIAIFSPSIEHAKRFASMLTARGIPCESLSISDRVERRKRLLAFSGGKLMAITAVDVMNEGIDVPDVNLLVFLRATHSRRIFVQQLGRGLRLAPDKDKVIVLDFVSDIRRMAEVAELDKEARNRGKQSESLFLRDGVVNFSDPAGQRFIEAWLSDVADLSNASDTEKLKFPEGL
ncbi:MAG: type I restriction enzyme EcoKI subunit R [Syntrophus sp. PtaB.Bin001]|nr:MAG: type I restriction enzyme EcoKI subunit R [Syntrophus sp. PtaB.Bin001]